MRPFKIFFTVLFIVLIVTKLILFTVGRQHLDVEGILFLLFLIVVTNKQNKVTWILALLTSLYGIYFFTLRTHIESGPHFIEFTSSLRLIISWGKLVNTFERGIQLFPFFYYCFMLLFLLSKFARRFYLSKSAT